MDDFKNKWRVDSARLLHWNYAAPGAYFVTMCTKNRIPFFGRLKSGYMDLSELGTCAHRCWLDIPLHFPDVVLDAHIVMPNHVHGIVWICPNAITHPKSNDDPDARDPHGYPNAVSNSKSNDYPDARDPHGYPNAVSNSKSNDYPNAGDPRDYPNAITHPKSNDDPDAGVETQNFASLRWGGGISRVCENIPPGRWSSHNRFGPQSRNLASIVRGFKIGVTKYATHHSLPFAWQPRYHDRIIRTEKELNAVRLYITHNAAKHSRQR